MGDLASIDAIIFCNADSSQESAEKHFGEPLLPEDQGKVVRLCAICLAAPLRYRFLPLPGSRSVFSRVASDHLTSTFTRIQG
jgi:hypothetical protein